MAVKLPTRPIGQKGDKRQPRKHDRDYLAFVTGLPCLICGVSGVHVAHVRYHCLPYGKDITGAGRKPSDLWCVPLCPEHHTLGSGSQHAHGERGWWKMHGVDPLVIAPLLFLHFTLDDDNAARQVALSARAITRHRSYE
jgi:hypothetical protein